MPDSNLLLLPQQFGTLSKRHLELVFGGFLEKVCISSHVLYSYSYGGEWLTGREGHNVPKNNLNIHIKNSLSAVYPQAGWHDSGVLVIKQGYKQRKVAIGPLQEYEYCTLYRPWRRQSKPCRESGFKSISKKEASQLICIIVSCQWTCNVATDRLVYQDIRGLSATEPCPRARIWGHIKPKNTGTPREPGLVNCPGLVCLGDQTGPT